MVTLTVMSWLIECFLGVQLVDLSLISWGMGMPC